MLLAARAIRRYLRIARQLTARTGLSAAASAAGACRRDPPIHATRDSGELPMRQAQSGVARPEAGQKARSDEYRSHVMEIEISW